MNLSVNQILIILAIGDDAIPTPEITERTNQEQSVIHRMHPKYLAYKKTDNRYQGRPHNIWELTRYGKRMLDILRGEYE